MPQSRVEHGADDAAYQRIRPHTRRCKRVQRLDQPTSETPRIHDHLGDDRHEHRDDHRHARTDEPCRNDCRDDDLSERGHRSEAQHPRDVVLAWMHRRHARGGVQHDGPQRGVCGEEDLGRRDGAQRQHGDRHQRDCRNGAQKVDTGHHIAPHGGYESDGETQCCAEGHGQCRGQRGDAEGVCEVSGELAAAYEFHERAQDVARGWQVLVVEQPGSLERLPTDDRSHRHRKPAERDDRPASHHRPAAPRPAGGEPAGSPAVRGSRVGRADAGVRFPSRE